MTLDKQQNIAGIFMVSSMTLLFIWIYYDDKWREERIQSCPYITIAYPTRWRPQASFDFYFYMNGKKREGSVTMTFPTMGKYERGRHLLKERFWVRANCKDYRDNKIYWNITVPDTLQYIPPNGWKEIPYGLAKNAKKE
jgi:hypothetical protein